MAEALGGVEPGLKEGERVCGEWGGERMMGAEALEEGVGSWRGVVRVHGLVLGEWVCPKGKEAEKEEARAGRLCRLRV